MFGFIVILFMTPSGHPWIINEIQVLINEKVSNCKINMRIQREEEKKLTPVVFILQII